MPALPRSTPEAQGIASTAVADFVAALQSTAHDIHSLMLVRHGSVVAEGWWRPYGADQPHSLFSISKSFTSAAVGLAVAEGLLELDDSVVALLPDDAPALVGDNLAAMTVRHLLTMSTGHAADTLAAIDRGDDDNWARAILAEPVENTPGTVFVYNSGATYLLSAILQRLTGERLLDYLTPRLFAPLGITGATWETCPRGIDVGGWGLALTTEDVATFGQLYLQRGEWNGAQLVPTDWVTAATSAQVSNGDPTVPDDWTQGYGYQFWRSQHGAYRADGAFGQLCFVLQDQDAVLMLTSGLTEALPALTALWEHLLPSFGTDQLPEDENAHRALLATLEQLELPHPGGGTESVAAVADRVAGVRFVLPANDAGFRSIAVDPSADPAELRITTADGETAIRCGRGEWVGGVSPFFGSGIIPADSNPAVPVAASAAWIDETTWRARVQYSGTPFALEFTLRFGDGDVALHVSQSVSFGSTELADVTGRAA
ncbi:serine hydrolase domain-containing protein [Lacisediminihabitans profunda]|uniref:Beta-lactamase family protein n=1 Tax=Lacisediminihabitans profunda TaxID=2594790 RepID=A0A5C8UQJ1_9MICO|nr:serine hydrolase domain-containing protein [Lacisediminihabitans profunda]TXN29707.1 beta-lactamase family protein [Lacisediminihabitans profunda]